MARSRSLRSLEWGDDAPDLFVEPRMVEPLAARRRRLDQKAKDGKKAQEIDRSGSVVNLERAAKRLRSARAEDRVLRVPQWDMAKAVTAMKRAGVTGAVSNLCGSKHKRVRAKGD